MGPLDHRGTRRIQETGPERGKMPGGLKDQSVMEDEGWEDHGWGTETKGLPTVPKPRQTPGKHSPARPIITPANPDELRSHDCPDVVKVI